MSYLAICTFDLKSASEKDYEKAYVVLGKIGLSRIIKSDSGSNIALPTTTTSGEFSGTSASEVRDNLLEQVKEAFSTYMLKAEIFLSVGGSWAWKSSTT